MPATASPPLFARMARSYMLMSSLQANNHLPQQDR